VTVGGNGVNRNSPSPLRESDRPCLQSWCRGFLSKQLTFDLKKRPHLPLLRGAAPSAERSAADRLSARWMAGLIQPSRACGRLMLYNKVYERPRERFPRNALSLASMVWMRVAIHQVVDKADNVIFRCR
jgi:hypothetical protein